MATSMAGAAPAGVPAALNPKQFRAVIITARWNEHITFALRDGARDALLRAGVLPENIQTLHVAGTVELVNAAAAVMNSRRPDAIIVIGCVIRGDTPHFDYVCMSVTHGVTMLNARGETPVAFGVLTVENEQQALDRAGGRLGNKGEEAAAAVVELANLHTSLTTPV